MIFFAFLGVVLMLIGLMTFFKWGKDKNHPNNTTGMQIFGLVLAGIGGIIGLIMFGGEALLSGMFSPY